MALWPSTLILLLSTLCISSSILAHEPKSSASAQAQARDPVPLYDDLGDLTYPIRTANERAQRYFDQGLRLAYAYRKLGDYTQALELNPHHRGALAYLGEAYVETGCMDHARTLLERLRVACQRLTATTADSGQSDCEAWQSLRDTIEVNRQPEKADCPLPGPFARLSQ